MDNIPVFGLDTKDKPERSGRTALFDLFRRASLPLWEAGIEAGLPRFIELANFLFLKLMEERGQGALWESLKAAPQKIGYLNEIALPYCQAEYNAHDVFPLTKITTENAAKKLIGVLDACQLASYGSNILGDAFEFFMKDNHTSKQNFGQFFTPRPLAKVLVGLASPRHGDTVYDPFCGAGGLLVEAFNHIGEQSAGASFFGRDVSVSTRAAKMNAILHWGSHERIEQVDNTLAYPVYGQYSIGLTNVPFARDPKNYPYDNLYENGLARKKTDVMSILHLFQSIKTGGRMAAIVPEGFLVGKERAAARRFLTDNADLRLVVSLPHGTFQPYTSVKAAIIYLDNIRCPQRTGQFWYYDAEDGLDALQGERFNGASEEELTGLGYTKVPFEEVRQNPALSGVEGHGSWIGKHYQDKSYTHSPYPLVSLGELVTFTSTGFSCKAHQLSEAGPFDCAQGKPDPGQRDALPLFTLKSVYTGQAKFLKEGTPVNEKSRCEEGDMLLAVKDRNKSSTILGRAAIANRRGAFSSDLVKLQINAKDLLSTEYLYYCFQDENYAREIRRFSVGSTFKGINLAHLASIKIPLPPLSVQNQVVEEFNQYERMVKAQAEAANFFHQKCRERLNALWRKPLWG